MTLQDTDLPEIYRSADQNSLNAQRWFLQRTVAELLLLVTAAAAGAITWQVGTADAAAGIAVVAFGGAALLRVSLLKSGPDKIWYEGRAAAESAKSLAWRYAVGARPFRIDVQSSNEADILMVERLREILTDLKGLHLVPSSNKGDQISPRMRALRAEPLKVRKAAYNTGRIEDQQDWYSRKASWNNNRAQLWTTLLLSLEILGFGAAILKVIGLIEVDLLGLAGAIVAAGISWLQTKQHSTLAEAYSVTAQELADIKALIDHQGNEEAWAHFVEDAEEAISKEHKLWKTSRGIRDTE